ncbi:26S proteasome complex ubiquitin receptor like protein [Zymoseptoria brevis]|uniref:26S proteasome complex ubiquitin receptor like protein n=1 Tax=Zymoseptoria brevis TaxID=1047168 RepID=A0A0F4GXR0_9PEZI|nr:26S proteasome complex ubiquitin receptor like protein [Zymoseptoria brevis]
MAEAPLITFKAGLCDFHGRKVTPKATAGYLYIYSEDDLLHFCWRPRSAPSTEPDLDLIMFPQDGHFYPLVKQQGAEDLHSPTNGRIFVLKFTSSSQKYFFWMQSKSQSRAGHLNWFSQRDQRLGQIIDALLQGEDVDVDGEIADLRAGGGGDDDGDNDDLMDLDGGPGLERHETGGAGQDATGGDPRTEGEASREGGEDGGRAPRDTDDVVQNFLRSLNGGAGMTGPSTSQSQQQQADKPFTTLSDLLPSSTTTSYISTATPAQIDELCTLLPPELFLLAQESDSSTSAAESTPAAAQAAIEALSTEQKKTVINRVLRSPQLQQSLASLTVALRDGGLPMIGEALGLKVENGGMIKHGSMPLGGGEAVEAFVKGVKKTVEEEGKGAK